MTSIQTDARKYLLWMQVHNYARTTICGRQRYLGYFMRFAEERGVLSVDAVTSELVSDYQHHVFAHRKRNGEPLSVGTQVQRLVPVAQFFSWLRRGGLVTSNPAADLDMPRPDRRLPEATLSATEMLAVLASVTITTPLGLRDRAVLEVFYSCQNSVDYRRPEHPRHLDLLYEDS